jgi:hypothetical protein
MSTIRTILFLCAAVSLGASVIDADGVLAQTSSEIPASAEYSIDNSGGTLYEQNLCAINTLYLGLRYIGDNDVDYSKLADKFEDVRVKGASLKQIKRFLDEKGIPCRFAEISFKDFSELPEGLMAFALKENRDPLNLSHLYFMRVLKDKTIQVVDIPSPMQIIEKPKITTERFFCLLVSKKEELLPAECLFSRKILLVFFFLFTFLVLFLSATVLNKRKSKDKRHVDVKK